MYSIKRIRKLFALTPKNRYRGQERTEEIDGTEIETEMDSKIPEKFLPLKWKDVDYYKVIDNDSSRKFKEHLEFLAKNSNKSIFTRSLVKRINQLLKDLKGKNSKKIQYVSKDNPDTKGLINIDNTHYLERLSNDKKLVYSKDINSEFRLLYEAERPHKENGKMVSDVVLDDADDHIYQGTSYIESDINKGVKSERSSNNNKRRFK